MKDTRIGFFVLFLVFVLALFAFAAPTNQTVSITGTSSDGNPFKLTLTVANNKWTESEQNGASKVFTTKSGVWERANNIVSLNKNDNKTRVATLNPLVPESAHKGDNGSGSAAESATTLTWTVD